MRRLVGAIAASTAASGAGVALLALSAWLISRAAEHPPVLFLLVAIVSVRALGLSRGVFRYVERLVGHDVALRRQDDLRRRVFATLADGTWVGRRSGDLLSRVVNDVAAAQDRVVRVIVPLTAAGLVASGTVVVLTLLSPRAGLLIATATLLGAVVVPWASGRLTAAADRSIAPLRGELATAVTEAHRAAPDLWAYDGSAALLDRVRVADAALRRAERRTSFVAGSAGAAQLVTTGAAVAAGLVTAAIGVSEGGLRPVQVAVLTLTPLALHEVLAGLPAVVGAARRTRTALDRVEELLRQRAYDGGEVHPVPAGSTPGDVELGVELSDVTVGWPGGPDVVRHLDLAVRAGERVALMGPSGAGKSTVAAALLGLLPVWSGTVTVAGPVGYLAQDAHLFDTTVAENLRIARRDASDADCRDALDRVGLDAPLDRLVGEHGSRLSGGEAQRVALARLLLRRDGVVILDEPTEHLDRPTADALTADLLAATADAAVLVITHDPELAARCDRVVELRGGPRRDTRSRVRRRQPCRPAQPAGHPGGR